MRGHSSPVAYRGEGIAAIRTECGRVLGAGCRLGGMAGDSALVAWVPMAAAGAPADWLLAELEGIRDRGVARVVVLDATESVAVVLEAMEPGQLRRLALFALPVVCCFEGEVGGGLAEIALAADIRVCGVDAVLEMGGRGPRMAAAELFERGLVTAVVGAGGARDEALRVAGVIASRGPIATKLAKEAIRRGPPQPLEQALRFETDLTLLLQTTKDRAEGVRAFLEKRPPVFTGE